MPITTQFSRQFYDTLGHEVADELVAWFNTVDATYRSEFRELFELNFSRFNDRLEREIRALRSEMEAKISELRSDLQARIAEGEARIDRRISAMEVRLIRWMFVFWIGSLGTMIALNRF